MRSTQRQDHGSETSSSPCAIKRGGYSPALAKELQVLEKDAAEYQNILNKIEVDSKVEFRKPSGEMIRSISKQLVNKIKTGDPADIRNILKGFIHRVNVKREGKDIKISIGFVNPVLIFMSEGECPHRDSNSSYSLERAVS